MHTLEELRRYLGETKWNSFGDPKNGPKLANPKIINGIAYTCIVGPHLGRPAVACVAEGQFVALRYFQLGPLVEVEEIHPPLTAADGSRCYVISGWGDWWTPESFDPHNPIISENCHETAQGHRNIW